MSSRIVQSQEELEHHLSEQINFLRRSASSFDNGYVDEVKRLATTLRILLHDTRRSRSLLGQLNRKDLFLDTAYPNDPPSNIAFCGLVATIVSPAGSRFAAFLDDHPPHVGKLVTFSTWWQQSITVDRNRRAMSRRQLILHVTNTDGGAHVDPELDSMYADLSRRDLLGWRSYTPQGPVVMTGAHAPAIRQIAHEVLKTLDPTYTCMPSLNAGEMIVGGLVLTGTPPASRGSDVLRSEQKLRRNDKCFCGSGKKYKNCHGK
jgi:hypothetical protein